MIASQLAGRFVAKASVAGIVVDARPKTGSTFDPLSDAAIAAVGVAVAGLMFFVRQRRAARAASRPDGRRRVSPPWPSIAEPEPDTARSPSGR